MIRKKVVWLALALGAAAGSAAAPAPLLLQHPTLSKDQIAFDFAGQIWTVAREGGVARVLVSGQGSNHSPIFSPDGQLVAYTGVYDQNPDVYVVPAGGGQPTRVTYYPGPDRALGWTPDGKSILFLSTRKASRDLPAALHRPGGRRVPQRAAASLGLARTSPTCPGCSGSRPGSSTAAGSRRRSGSPTSPTPASARSRARTRTTSARCGWVTASTSSPTARER